MTHIEENRLEFPSKSTSGGWISGCFRVREYWESSNDLMGCNPPPAMAALAPSEELATEPSASVENAEVAAPATGAFKAPFLLGLVHRLPR